MENATEKLFQAYLEIDKLNQEGAIFYPSEIKTMQQVASDLMAIVKDPLTRVYNDKKTL